MSKEMLTWFFPCLIILGFMALVLFSLYNAFRNTRNFSSLVNGLKSGWDEFINQTGLHWELKQPGSPNIDDNPVLKNLFDPSVVNLTGRVVGTYRNYPVILENQGRNHYAGSPRLMISNQRYYTEFLLTIKNQLNTDIFIRKENQFKIEPQDEGMRFLSQSKLLDRLTNLPGKYGIGIKKDTLVYVADGIVLDPKQLCAVLDVLCDLADSLKRA